jgi:hypothetical protein
MKKYLYIICLVFLLGGNSCTDDFDYLNRNPTAITLEPRYLPYMFTYAENFIDWSVGGWQVAQNLYADLYAQYYALMVTNFPSDRYVPNMNWLESPWDYTYLYIMPQLASIHAGSEPESPEYALADILWVWMFHRMADMFGPLPYYGAGMEVMVPYVAVDQMYDDFFKRLTQAANSLQSHPDATPFKGYDIIYDGDRGKWLRFCNTLRLRLAMRISKVDPARAKAEAEAAVASGVFLENTDCATLYKNATTSATFWNGMAQTASYNEFGMSATMVSYLKGYNDIRMMQFFQPAKNTGTYEGLRNGLPVSKINEDRNQPPSNSNIGTYWVTLNSSGSFTPNVGARSHLIHCAEAYFLRAEGALNGWNMNGNAKDLYEEGIRKSLSQWGATEQQINEYLTSSALPVPPGDSENSPAVSTTPIPWSSILALQRKQIGTQKWLAVWPDGHEGWAEFRRTGYPDIYPVVQNDNADIPEGECIKRLPYPPSEAISNPDELEKGRALLGGKDNCNTRLWWDVD